MYGTIFAMEVKEGHKQALLGEFNNQGDPNGMYAWLIMHPDNDDTHMRIFHSIGNSKSRVVAHAICDDSSKNTTTGRLIVEENIL